MEIPYTAETMVFWRAANFLALHARNAFAWWQYRVVRKWRCNIAFACAMYNGKLWFNETITGPDNDFCQSSSGAGAGAGPEAERSLVATPCHGVLHVVGLMSAVVLVLSTNLVDCFHIMLCG